MKPATLLSLLFVLLCAACGASAAPADAKGSAATDGTVVAAPAAPGEAIAIFAGGCFWCMEGPYEAIDGVSDAISGYTGGPEQRPTYQEVSSGSTGHTEAVLVRYDPKRVTYKQLVDLYWRTMNPTDAGGQFGDRGTQYRPAIYVSTPEERATAEASRAELEASKRFEEPIIVPIEQADTFWVAEDYHQDYYKTHALNYRTYRSLSGRKGFLTKKWGVDVGAH
jgi:methionine-S-sulfoxide reductase